jgi:potassium-transporting ATPase potassium-binding subunit
MTGNDWLYLLSVFSVLAIATPWLGGWMARVFSGERHWLSPLVVPVENLMYRLGGIDPQRSMAWQEYLATLVVFNLFGFVAVFGLQIFQSCPLIPPAAVGAPGACAGSNTSLPALLWCWDAISDLWIRRRARAFYRIKIIDWALSFLQLA